MLALVISKNFDCVLNLIAIYDRVVRGAHEYEVRVAIPLALRLRGIVPWTVWTFSLDMADLSRDDVLVGVIDGETDNGETRKCFLRARTAFSGQRRRSSSTL